MKSFLLYLFLVINLFSNFVTAEIILPADIVEGQDSNKNWIKNSHFEKNVNSVSSYADSAGTAPVDGTGGSATITCTRTTSSPISGDGSLLITKDAANRQGQGCSIPFTIDRGDRASMQTIVFPYEVASGTFVAGTDSTNSDLVMWVYDVTNSVLIPVQGTGRFYSNSSDYFYGYFQTNSNSTSYRLIFHQALTGTSAYTTKVDNVKIFKSKFALGTPITDMATYTCVLRGSSNGSTFSNQTTTCKYRRVGDIAELDIYTTFSGTPGTGTGDFRWTIPSGLTIDTTKMVNTGNNSTLGSFSYTDSGTAFYMAAIPTYGSTTDIGAMANGASASAINTTSPITWTTNDNLKIQAKVPILGWSSGTQISDGFNSRPIIFEARTNAGAISTSAATYVTLTWSAVNVDTVAGWNGTDTYTVKTSDCYDLQVLANQNSAAAAYLDVAYRIDGGSEVLIGRAFGAAAAGGVATGTATVCLTAGQTIQARAQTEGTQGIGPLRRFTIKRSGGGTPITSATNKFAFQGRGATSSSVGSNTVVKFSTITEDTHGCWNSTNGDCTVPYNGTYNVTCSSRITTGGTASVNQYMDAIVQIEAATVSEFANYVQSTGVGAWSGTSSWQGPMTAGQKARCIADTNITSPSLTTGTAHTYMIMFLVK